MKNKKGSAQDLVVISAVLLVTAFIFFLVKFSSSMIVTQITAVPVIANNTHATEVFNSIETSTDRFDYLFFGVFVALFLSIIITGWYVGGDALFAVVYFMVAVVAVIGSMIMANVWYDISNSSLFGMTLSSMPITNHIVSNLPVYIAVMAITGLIAMFSKTFVGKAI